MADIFTLKPGSTVLFNVDDSGNVTAAGTISTTGTDDFGAVGLKTDVIAESTAATGVTVDGMLIKDGGILVLDSATVVIGTGSDDTISHNGTLTTWTHTTGSLVIDNTDVNDPIVLRLGTDTTATGLEVRNNSDVAKFKVDGAGAVWVNGGTLDMSTGASDLYVPDNNATALRIREKTNSRDYIIIDTGDASESIQFGDAAVNPTYSFVGTGAMAVGGALNVTGAITATGGITGTALAGDESVVATVAVADAAGGATDALLSVTLKRRDNSTAVASARQVLLTSGPTQYAPMGGPTNASLTLGTVTAGSIVATITTGAQWLVETDATGVFACTATDTEDGTLYFAAATASGGVSDLTKRAIVLASNSDAAAWSA